MKCERCKTVVAEGEQRALHGQILCEDCYMDLLSPLRVCDPWAVHSAMTFAKEEATALKLTPVQQKIVNILEKEGPQEPENLCERLQIKETEYLTSTFDIHYSIFSFFRVSFPNRLAGFQASSGAYILVRGMSNRVMIGKNSRASL